MWDTLLVYRRGRERIISEGLMLVWILKPHYPQTKFHRRRSANVDSNNRRACKDQYRYCAAHRTHLCTTPLIRRVPFSPGRGFYFKRSTLAPPDAMYYQRLVEKAAARRHGADLFSSCCHLMCLFPRTTPTKQGNTHLLKH